MDQNNVCVSGEENSKMFLFIHLSLPKPSMHLKKIKESFKEKTPKVGGLTKLGGGVLWNGMEWNIRLGLSASVLAGGTAKLP